MRLPRLLLAGLLALGSLTGAALAADEVVVRVRDGEQLSKGNITKDDVDGLTIESGGATPTFPMKDIVRDKVKYDCLKRHYDVGEVYFRERRYESARDQYEDAVADDKVKEQAKQYVYRRIAQCHERLGDPAKAAEAWKKLQDAMPRTCFAREMAEGLFVNYLKLGKYDEASRSLSSLEKLGEEGKSLAQVYRAELAERKGDYGAAAESYANTARAAQTAETQSRSWAGAARCLAMDGKIGEAVQAAKSVLAVKGVVAVCAADAHQVMGEALLKGLPEKPAELAEEKNRERALDAIEEMMRAVVQYPGSQWAEPRAYYFVGLLAERLAAAGVVGEWDRRARWANDQLLSPKFANTPEARKLSERVKK